jgi:hypothetical protein
VVAAVEEPLAVLLEMLVLVLVLIPQLQQDQETLIKVVVAEVLVKDLLIVERELVEKVLLLLNISFNNPFLKALYILL